MPASGTRKDLGKKHVCHECGAKYYDLHRPVPTCPKCGADPRETPEIASRPAAAAHRRPPLSPSPKPPSASADDQDDDEDEDDDDDKAIEVMADPSFTPPGFVRALEKDDGDDDTDDDSDDDDDKIDGSSGDFDEEIA